MNGRDLGASVRQRLVDQSRAKNRPFHELLQYPSLLDFPNPVLWAYLRETVIAEKLEALTALGIAKEIVSAHGGDIEVSSSQEEGTTFIASLPRATPTLHAG